MKKKRRKSLYRFLGTGTDDGIRWAIGNAMEEKRKDTHLRIILGAPDSKLPGHRRFVIDELYKYP